MFSTDLIKNGLLKNIKQLENYETVHSVIIFKSIIYPLLKSFDTGQIRFTENKYIKCKITQFWTTL